LVIIYTELNVVAQDVHWLMTFPGFRSPGMHSDAGKREGLVYKNVELYQAEPGRHIATFQGDFTVELRVLLVLE